MSTLQQVVQALAQGQPTGQVLAGGVCCSFQELAQAALQRAASFPPSFARQRLALAATPEMGFLVNLLACWQLGALPLILSPWQAQQLQSQLASAASGLSALGAVALWQAEQGWHNPQPLDPSERYPALKLPEATPDSPALVLFTSGSSGQPKGVVLSHGQILAQLEAVAVGMELSHPARVGVMLPLQHAFALITQVLLTLYTGGELHLLAPLLPGERLLYLTQHRIQRLAGVPTHFRLLFETAEHLPELQHLTVAGAALDQRLAQRLQAQSPQASLWVGYGLTEAGPRVSALSHHDPHFAQGSVGRPLPGVSLRLGPDSELEVQSPSCLQGYLDDPQSTAQVLQGGWLKTGDLASIQAGYLYISGRRDEVFQVAGEKIAPLEIEKLLLACPGVRGVAVWGEADALLGQRLAALIEGSVSLQALRRYARQQLPPEKRPQSWYAVESLPLNANGKLLRKELSQWPKRLLDPSL